MQLSARIAPIIEFKSLVDYHHEYEDLDAQQIYHNKIVIESNEIVKLVPHQDLELCFFLAQIF